MNEKIKYKIIFFTRFFGEFIFNSFLTLYLKRMNYSGTKIGTILSFTPLILVFVLPLWSRLDYGNFRKKIVVIAAFFTVIFEFLLVLPLPFIFISIFAIFYSISRAPFGPSIDSMSNLYCKECNYEYSIFRSYGSAGFIAAIIVGGFLIDYIDYKWFVAISAIIFIIFSVTSLSLKPLNMDIKKPKANIKIIDVFKNKLYLKFLIAMIFASTMLNINCSYELLYINMRGISNSLYGLYTVIRVGFEILFLMLMSKTKKSYKSWLYIAALLLLGESAIYYFMAPKFMIFIGAVLAGASSGIFIYMNNKYVVKIIKPENLTTTLYIGASFSNLIFTFITFSTGLIYDNFGLKNIYLFSGISLLIGMLMIALLIKKIYPNTIIEIKE